MRFVVTGRHIIGGAALETGDQRCQLVGDLARIRQRDLYTAGVVGRAARPPTHLAPDELTQGDVHRGHPKPRPESRPDLIVYLDSGHAVALACGLLGCCLGSQSPLLAHVYKHTMHHRMQLCAAGRSVSGAERQGCLFGVAVMAGRSGMRVGDGERRGVLGSGSSVVGSSGAEGWGYEVRLAVSAEA